MANEVSSKDTIQVLLSGLMHGSTGRQTHVVNYNGLLAQFLEQYGDGTKVEEPEIDPAQLKKLAATDPDKLMLTLSELGQKLVGGTAKPLPSRIVDAVCNYLVKEHDFVISDSDPGSNVYYVSRGDIKPSRIDIPGDGSFWMIAAAAPFGA